MAKQQGPCPSHPGEILKEALEDLGLSPSAAADKMGVSRQWLSQLMRPENPAQMFPETALRVGKLIGNGAEIWMSLQVHYDLWHARQKVGVKKIPTVSKGGRAA